VKKIFILLILVNSLIFAQNSKIIRKNTYVSIPPPVFFSDGTGLKKANSFGKIVVTYHDFPDDEKKAFEYAKNIWQSALYLSTDITIDAYWTDKNSDGSDIEDGILGYCSVGDYISGSDINNDNFYGSVKYPVSIVNNILGYDYKPGRADMEIRMNKEHEWYLGTDGIPQTDKLDLVTTVLHEICHGLGFTSGVNADNANKTASIDKNIYDTYIRSTSHLVDISGRNLYDQITSKNLWFDGLNAMKANKGSEVRLYAPSPYEGGSSISHLDTGAFKNDKLNWLMMPGRNMAEAIHSPGPVVYGILADLGWEITYDALIITPSNDDLLFSVSNPQKIEIFSTFMAGANIYLENSSGVKVQDIRKSADYNIEKGMNTITDWSIPNNLPVNTKYRICIESGTYKRYSLGWFNISHSTNPIAAPKFSVPDGTIALSSITTKVTCSTPGVLICVNQGDTESWPKTPDLNNYYSWYGNVKCPCPSGQEITIKSYYAPNERYILIARAVLPRDDKPSTEWLWGPSTQVSYTIREGIPIIQVDESGGKFGIAQYTQSAQPNSWVSAPNDKNVLVKAGDIYLKADQSYIEGKGKWLKWDKKNYGTTTTSWQNYHKDNIVSLHENFTAQFKQSRNATIRLAVEGTLGMPSGSLEFKDPWLADFNDVLGKRNLGMSAKFKQVGPTFTPNTNTAYLGVHTDQTIQGKIYYSARTQQTQTYNGQPVYFTNWFGTNCDIPNKFSLETPIIFTRPDAVVTANYKASRLSNDAAAYTNNSQRKIVRTKDGWLHQVYSSMNRVWIEHSSNGGTTWFLGNNGQPLDNGEGKCPSIDWWYTPSGGSSPELHNLVVAYQQKEGSAYSIRYALFEKQNGNYTRLTPISNYDCLYNAVTESYTSNANPNITVGDRNFALTFEKKNSADAGIYWIYGFIDRYGVYGYYPNTNNYDYGVFRCSGPHKITGTNANSINASVSINKSNTDNVFDVVFEQSNTNTIRDVILACPYYSNWSPSEVWSGNLSTSSGYLNYKPSMVQLSNNNIKVCWIRDLYGGGSNTPNYVNVVYWSSTSPNTFNYYGNMVNSVSLNIKDNSDDTYFAYAQKTNNSNWQNFARNGSGTVTLSTTGRQIQLSNGPSSTAMYASAYYPVSAPYYFQTLSLPAGLSKSSGEINYGRGLYLSKDELQFNYSVKSLKVDNAGIQFVEIPENTDTNKSRRVKYLELDELNKMLLSEPFSVGAGSDFAFCDDAGFIDKEAAEQLLGKDGKIVCKIELIDDATKKTLGLINESIYSSENLPQGIISNYTLNTEGLKNTMARVKITISSNIKDLQGVFVSEYGTIDKETLAKASVTELTLKKEGVVTEYALEQNYPNPFNPSTTIKYQIPESPLSRGVSGGRGVFVTLKVYNILGEEVATLVNGFKNAGRYEVKFDASNLASGVYVYRLSAGDFNASKKLMLLK